MFLHFQRKKNWVFFWGEIKQANGINPPKIYFLKIFCKFLPHNGNLWWKVSSKIIYTFYLNHQKYPFCAPVFHPLSETESLLICEWLYFLLSSGHFKEAAAWPILSVSPDVRPYICMLYVCGPLPVKFILRPLIGPQVTWSVQCLSLVNPPSLPHSPTVVFLLQ